MYKWRKATRYRTLYDYYEWYLAYWIRSFSDWMPHLYSRIRSLLLHKKSNTCQSCHDLLTTDRLLEVNNDVGSQYTLINLVDRGSLKYPSSCVVKSVTILYKAFLMITVIRSARNSILHSPVVCWYSFLWQSFQRNILMFGMIVASVAFGIGTYWRNCVLHGQI